MNAISIFETDYVNEENIIKLSSDNKEPEWFLNRRKLALQNFHELPLDKDTLFYKYTNFRKFDPSTLKPNYKMDTNEIVMSDINEIKVDLKDNSKNVKVNLDKNLIDQGVFFGPLMEFIEKYGSKAQTIIETINPFSVEFDKLGSLAIAFAANPLILYVPKGVQIDTPLVKLTQIPEEGIASFNEFIAYFEQDTKVTLIELLLHEETPAITESLYSCMNTIYLEDNSNVHVFTLQNWSQETVHLYSRNVVLNNYSKLTALTHIQGSQMVRQNNLMNLNGTGAEGYDLYVKLGSNKQRFDIKSELNHLTKDTIGQTHARTVMMDKSESILRGLITITENAVNADSWLTSKGLTVGKAKISAIPSLSILQNDVKAAHAASVEPLNEDSLFYLQTRGVDLVTARELLVKGYFEYVLRLFKNDQAVEISRFYLNRKWQEVS